MAEQHGKALFVLHRLLPQRPADCALASSRSRPLCSAQLLQQRTVCGRSIPDDPEPVATPQIDEEVHRYKAAVTSETSEPRRQKTGPTRFKMARITLPPTEADVYIASAIAAHTTPGIERAARVMTWGADEKVLLAIAVGGWLYATHRPALRPITNHFLAASMLTAILPHLLKSSVDQIRPDRLTVAGHWRGIPYSGHAHDAFPSGHAIHMGALASAAALLPPRPRRILRALAVTLSATRVVLLAHWTSDVVASFAMGALIERIIRPITTARAGAAKP